MRQQPKYQRAAHFELDTHYTLGGVGKEYWNRRHHQISTFYFDLHFLNGLLLLYCDSFAFSFEINFATFYTLCHRLVAAKKQAAQRTNCIFSLATIVRKISKFADERTIKFLI